MSHKSRALKGKVIVGYLLLFILAVFSIWFVYTEILKIAKPDATATTGNQKIIKISNAIANLYASESAGRNSILTGSTKDHAVYIKMVDSVSGEIEAIKAEMDAEQLGKLDTIQMLLQRKKRSLTEVIRFRKEYEKEAPFERASRRIYATKDSMVAEIKPVKISDSRQFQGFLRDVLTQQQIDSLSKLPLSNDSLTIAFVNQITKVVVRENKLRNQLFKKEQKVLEENRVISDQLRVVLSQLEKQILDKSYSKIVESQKTIDNTMKTIAWVGAISLFLLILFAWIIIRDVSINQRYRDQLEVLNAEKEDLLRSKTMLLATVTHDIQTPLGSVVGFTDLLKKTEINSKQLQYLENIKHSSNYIIRLVNDLVDFSKLENNRISIDKVSFNFKDLILNTCKPLEPNAENKGIELNWDIDEKLDSLYISDPYRLKQIFTNLISNAIKFTQEGSVEVLARKENDKIIVSVIDTGIGIAKEKQKAVFKEFTQAHDGIEKKFGGTGLGLTIAKKMLRLLDGKISVDSQENQGSIFTVIIPAIASENQPENIESQVINQEYPFLADKKILIVDDDAMQLSLMQEIFSKYPCQITTLIDAGKVINLLQYEKFDLILTDIQMPNLDGFELVKLIRLHENKQVSEVPVIALSGKRNLTADDFLSKGFTAFHSKPLQLDLLLQLMEKVFSGEELIASEQFQNKKTSEKLFDLSSLNQFTQNDEESLKLILDTFFESVATNKAEMIEAFQVNDQQKMSATAHKMIPMLKQMEVYEISDLLEPIEDQSLQISTSETKEYLQNIFKKLDELEIAIKKEFDKN